MSVSLRAEIEPQFETIDGISVRYAQSDTRDHEQHALLLSPWPESLFAFAPAWSWLSDHAHLIAIDLPGFGHSERRDSLLCPSAMGEFLVRVADTFELEQPHLLGPDVGTAASLFAAARHPTRFRSLVVGGGAASVPLNLGPPLRDWVEATDLEPYRQADSLEIIAGIMNTLEQYRPPDSVLKDYYLSYEGSRFVNSMRYVRAYPADLPVLAGLLTGIETPVQIISGKRDRVVPLANAEYLKERLPVSRLDVLDAGHFAWEDAARQYSAIVSAWWSGVYRDTLDAWRRARSSS
jgi:pimeloyl-ACP methyl ester carboxylesterase